MARKKPFRKRDKAHIAAVYDMAQIIDAIQVYYKQTYPVRNTLGKSRIRAILMFFLDLIMHSVDEGARVTIVGFGAFEKNYCKESYFKPGMSDENCYRPPHYRVRFQASQRFKQLLNKTGDKAFEENADLLDTMFDIENPPEETVEEKDKTTRRKVGRPRKHKKITT